LRIGFAADSSGLDSVAVGLWEGRRPTPSYTALGSAASRAVAASPRFSGKEGEAVHTVTADGRHLMVLGLGPEEAMDTARAERLGGHLVAALNGLGAERLGVQLDLPALFAAHVAFGLRLRSWRPPPSLRRPLPADEAPTLTDAVLIGDDADWPPLEALADSICTARDLAVLPGNLLGPAAFEAHARALTDLGCTVEVLDAAELSRQGLALLAAVGQGSAQPARLVVVRWSGADGAPLVFVGKGITFDSGGLSIKHGDAMAEMKGDMAGAAAALMALRTLAVTRVPVHAVAVLAIAENMPSGRALRPGDVLRAYSGQIVEVVDTDAEGRLVLADALAWSCATLKPRALVDLATLTGAIVTTLGHHHAGLFANDDGLAAALLAAGEPLWRLPLSDSYDEDLKSPVADIRNCAWGRVPDALHAARFLQGFVTEGVPWAHLDIAGTADAVEDGPMGIKGPTGFGVRLLVAWASSAGRSSTPKRRLP